MKIRPRSIPLDGIVYEEKVSSAEWDLETESIKYATPLYLRVEVAKITNTLSVVVLAKASILIECARCLNQVTIELEKHFQLNYAVSSLDQIIDIGPDIREELILDYPLKPLCKLDCQGLCPRCGKDLNQEKCKHI